MNAEQSQRRHTPYEADFHAWTLEQAALLKAGRWHRLDIENLVEEIESLGRAERRELRNRLVVLVGHLLKWQFQPDRRSNSWQATITGQRREILELLLEQPSLKSYLDEAFVRSWESGVDLAVKETDLPYSHFPDACPYTFEQALGGEFWPG
ncbi:MAG: DUF29 domain-containing protein [Gemmatimonadaceae bacterium]|nr:DUF29 domain-containing protein [Gloeobacterales cyanobacterium ES-bin-141]